MCFTSTKRKHNTVCLLSCFSSVQLDHVCQPLGHNLDLTSTISLSVRRLGQGCPNSVLEGQCPAEFRSNLPQHTCHKVSSMSSKSLISWFRCVWLGFQDTGPSLGTLGLGRNGPKIHIKLLLFSNTIHLFYNYFTLAILYKFVWFDEYENVRFLVKKVYP